MKPTSWKTKNRGKVKMVTPDTKRSKEWPQNPIALSRRLHPLQASLRTQGITVEFSRGKERTITVKQKREIEY